MNGRCPCELDGLLAELAAARYERDQGKAEGRKILAELAAAREQNQTLRKALDAAMQYVDPKDRDWIERLGGGPWA